MSKSYVNYGSCAAGKPGSTMEITGARFNLSPMSDDFKAIILGAIKQVDLSKVWSETDHISTVYRGKEEAVFDALKAAYVYAYKEGVHMSLEATISKGCPGDSDSDYTLELDNPKVNQEDTQSIDFPVIGKFALYPMGSDDYMATIAEVVNEGIDRGVVTGSGHYGTNLGGSVQDVFAYLEYVSKTVGSKVSHYVSQITLLCNVPKGDI
ncbi:Additional substrate-binding component of thiamin-regulated ECF transporter for HydroxyMethylPyrimidine [Alkalibacterium sp. AK22]|uniref:YkoF family thiamine/hydroxymethylpyrimidine-binding protein n=1 Tax=Alkalibacterium sp. AK22 TaxID=1229520 RepID=UPI00045305A5|nr:YkoF family thiamine/hydroxymethylpyrimidine-binding protein [Alkalibacterium sp. AK22]EXJ23855.1 Additional substrate-binding component of thiamin-regulated ECF transporter for HydroxyMethylPyrimidine [Alkalibacterium sp. AK22]